MNFIENFLILVFFTLFVKSTGDNDGVALDTIAGEPVFEKPVKVTATEVTETKGKEMKHGKSSEGREGKSLFSKNVWVYGCKKMQELYRKHTISPIFHWFSR